MARRLSFAWFMLMCLLLAQLLVSAGNQAIEGQYQIVDLGETGSNQPPDINNKGEIAGMVIDAAGAHAAIWRNAIMTLLPSPVAGADTFAWGLNDEGDVVGAATFPPTNVGGGIDAAVWGKATPFETFDLGSFPCGYSAARTISNDGKVAGEGCIHNTTANTIEEHALFWNDGVLTDLGTLGGLYSTAFGVNNKGQVVGGSNTASNQFHAFLWAEGKMIDLGTLGGTFSFATAINNKGQIVGKSTISNGQTRGFLWENGKMTALEILPNGYNSEAWGLNERGEVVGDADFNTPNSGILSHAILWKNGEITDLGTLPGNISSTASAINARGDIVGFAYNGSQRSHLVLWKTKGD